MYRTTLTLIGMLLANGAAFSQEASPAPSVGQSASAGANDALEIMKDHMRSQLDWRSYFTNRMDARRRASAAGDRIRQEPRAADAAQRTGEGVGPEAEVRGRP